MESDTPIDLLVSREWNGTKWHYPNIERMVEENKRLRAELAAAIKQRDEARELYCRQIACGLFRTTGVFDPKEIAIKRGWVGLFRVNEPGSPKTAAPIHREPAPTPAPPPKKFFKEGGGA